MSDFALGQLATVFICSETGEPITVPLNERKRADLHDIFDSRTYVDDIPVVSVWAMHVALYALQQGTEDARQRALELLGRCAEIDFDGDTLLPTPVSVPDGWLLAGEEQT